MNINNRRFWTGKKHWWKALLIAALGFIFAFASFCVGSLIETKIYARQLTSDHAFETSPVLSPRQTLNNYTEFLSANENEWCSGAETICITMMTDRPGKILKNMGGTISPERNKKYRLRIAVEPIYEPIVIHKKDEK